MTALGVDADLRSGYDAARAKYRIGERLRLCAGCTGCSDVCFDGPNCRWCRENPPLCSGSGVLPSGNNSQRKAAEGKRN